MFEQFVEISMVVLTAMGMAEPFMKSSPHCAMWMAAAALKAGGGWLIYSLGEPWTRNRAVAALQDSSVELLIQSAS